MYLTPEHGAVFSIQPYAGADPGGGGAHPARAPPKIGKNKIFWRKIVIFTRNTPTFFAPPSAWRNFFKCAPSNLKSWIRPCYVTMFVSGLSLLGFVVYMGFLYLSNSAPKYYCNKNADIKLSAHDALLEYY